MSPLLVAIVRGHFKTAQLLIDKGVDVNKCDRVCMTLNYCKDKPIRFLSRVDNHLY